MKPFDDLTHPEKAALTTEEINHYKKIRAAEEGVPLPRPEPIPFSERQPAQDVVLYCVGDWKFLHRSEAEELQAFLMERQGKLFQTDYHWSTGVSTQFMKGFEGSILITEQSVYSPARYSELNTLISEYGERKKLADDERRAWEKEQKDFDLLCNCIMSEVSEARSRLAAEAANQRRFDEYLELSEGDAELAWVFFTKAGLELEGFYPVGTPETVKEIES